VIAEAQDVLVVAAPPRWQLARGVLADYLSLAKPRIMLLLLITEYTAMITAARGWPGLSLSLAALAGGAPAIGGRHAHCLGSRRSENCRAPQRPEHRLLRRLVQGCPQLGGSASS